MKYNVEKSDHPGKIPVKFYQNWPSRLKHNVDGRQKQNGHSNSIWASGSGQLKTYKMQGFTVDKKKWVRSASVLLGSNLLFDLAS